MDLKEINMKFSNDWENWIECNDISIGALMKLINTLYYNSDVTKFEIIISNKSPQQSLESGSGKQ